MSQTQNAITIYRGSHQIGGCATEIRSEGYRILIDFGANLPGSGKEGVLTEFLVDHSALDAYMFLIEVGGKKNVLRS